MGFVLIVISCYMRERINELLFICNPKLQFVLTDNDQRFVSSLVFNIQLLGVLNDMRVRSVN